MMEEVTGLKLIQVVDPTKIKVTINEKFAKLTLSSNKKKKLQKENLIPNDPMEIEKRRSASRNLIDELSGIENDQIKNSNPLCINAILRSSSLTSCANESQNKTETMTETFDFKVEDVSANAESMERLQMSDEICSENDMDEIAQKISDLTVNNMNVPSPRSLCSPIVIEILSSSGDENDDEHQIEESIISLSDTPENSIVKDCFKDYNFMATSDLQSSNVSDGLPLPCTLSNVCADRIEAFLRDVSQEQRIMEATGRLADDSLIAHLTIPIEENEEKSNVLLECAKAKLIATAETESMSPEDTEINGDENLKKQNATLDDTEAMNELAEVSFFPQVSNSLKKSNNTIDLDELKRHANDDTEANTTNNSFEKTHHSELHVIEDSIVISETSSEDIDNSCNTSKLDTSKKQDLVPSEEALSASLRKDSTLSQYGLSIASINISAKINIKLQINANLSFNDESSTSSTKTDNEERVETNEELNLSSEDIATMSEHLDPARGTQALLENRNENELRDQTTINMSPEALATYEKIDITDNNVNFMAHAQKLLTELYGNSWQTPEVIRTLKRTSNEQKSKANEPKSGNNNSTRAETSIAGQRKAAEESTLDDFSMFQKDIVKTNLDSTRLITPQPKQGKKLFPHSLITEPKSTPKRQVKHNFKVPQTELKKKTNAVKQNVYKKNEVWRKIVDDDIDSDDNNITDDIDADQTVMTDDDNDDDDDEEKSNASDSSWHNSDEEISEDDDFKVPTINTTRTKTKVNKKKQQQNSSNDRLIYLDLSKDSITFVDDSPNHSPPANKDENFENRLSEILSNCRYEDKPKIPATPKSTGKSKRRLFTVSYNDEIEEESIVAICRGEQKKTPAIHGEDNMEEVRFNGEPIPSSFNIYNKHIESVKGCKPVFKMTPTREKTPRTPIAAREERTPFKNNEKILYQTPSAMDKRRLDQLYSTPSFKYSFLKSLDVCVGKSLCHPDAIVFRENYRNKKGDLANILYELYNAKLFDNNLIVPLVWNKKLSNTAGRCLNKKKLGKRLSVIELSEKVLTSADRLRCTLIHELCHAATWIFDGEGGHGAKWKEWARKANAVFPDLPKIGVCHQYDIEYKYTYKCTLCAAKSYYHSKSKKVENIRCSYCYGAIEIFLNKKDKDGNIMPTPVKEPTGFAKFVKEKYQQYKRPDMKHAEVMKLLSNEFAALKVAGNLK